MADMKELLEGFLKRINEDKKLIMDIPINTEVFKQMHASIVRRQLIYKLATELFLKDEEKTN